MPVATVVVPKPAKATIFWLYARMSSAGAGGVEEAEYSTPAKEKARSNPEMTFGEAMTKRKPTYTKTPTIINIKKLLSAFLFFLLIVPYFVLPGLLARCAESRACFIAMRFEVFLDRDVFGRVFILFAMKR